WRAFAEEADFAALNSASDSGVHVAEAVSLAAATDPRHAENVSLYFEHFEKSLTVPIDSQSADDTDLKASGTRLLGLSNWSAETFHHAPQVAPAITQLEDVVVSGREGLIKPDPAIFEILRERFGLDPVRTVFIDDLPANVEAARSLG